ncbi:MAG: hypothetical protein ACLQMO_16050 [Acidobacteriaceae bacterium]
MAVEKYVLNELPPQLRDEFEEHYFSCQECAADVRATTAFLDAAKTELKAASVSKPSPVIGAQRKTGWFWRPAFLVPAFAASLLVVAYQNVVVYPRLNQQIAQSSTPEVLPSLSLVGGNSRGGPVPSITVRSGQPFLLSLDIPTQERFSTYTCSLYSPAGKLVWHVQVSAQQAKDTISIRIPAVDRIDGKYSMVVQGNLYPSRPGTQVDLASYNFVFNSQK